MPLNNQPNEGCTTPVTTRRHTEQELRLRSPQSGKNKTVAPKAGICTPPKATKKTPKNRIAPSRDESTTDSSDDNSDHSTDTVISIPDAITIKKEAPKASSWCRKIKTFGQTVKQQLTLNNAKATASVATLVVFVMVAIEAYTLYQLNKKNFPQRNDTAKEATYKALVREAIGPRLDLCVGLMEFLSAGIVCSFIYVARKKGSKKESNHAEDNADTGPARASTAPF